MDTRFLVCFFFFCWWKRYYGMERLGLTITLSQSALKHTTSFSYKTYIFVAFWMIRLFSLRLSTWKCSKCQIRKKLSTSGSLVENHYMKLNTGKCHLHVSITKYGHSWAKLGDNKMWECNQVKLLVVTIDNKTKFNSYVVNFCC